MRRINLVVFNENYWTGGLIYSQNIKPLLAIKKTNPDVCIRLMSFTSVLMWILKYKEIKDFKKKLRQDGIDNVVNYPVLFVPSRWFILRWFMIPMLLLSCLPYMIYVNIADGMTRRKQVYNLRSYGSSLIFMMLYHYKSRLFFDTRTDYIVEQINQSIWTETSISNRIWLWAEGIILKRFNKSFFISEPQMADTLNRHGIEKDTKKYVVIYNPVDLKYLSVKDEKREDNFVYSGSLGNWNNIQLYLDFFLQVKNFLPDSKLIIMTPTPYAKLKEVFENKKYETVRNSVELIFNATSEVLTGVYAKSKWGLQLMSKKDSRVGVKVVEYIASGLIPIVSTNVRGAAQLISDYQLGKVYDGRINREDLFAYNTNEQKRKEFLELIKLESYSRRLYQLYDEV